MQTYQVRKRYFVWPNDVEPSFPAEGEVQFTLAPPGAFGSGELSDSVVLHGAPHLYVRQQGTGRYVRTEPQQMDPIECVLSAGGWSVEAKGNLVSVRSHFESRVELADLVESISFALPAILALRFRDAPVVSAVSGVVGGSEFTWAYGEYFWQWQVTSKEIQEQNLFKSWDCLRAIASERNPRLAAALHYFQVACRLSIAGCTPWEFMSEIILNFAKVLEVLFPPQVKDQGSADAARSGLKTLGYVDEDIEKWFVPIIYLRNQLDSGHASLVSLDPEALEPVHACAAHAEDQFRSMLLRTVDAVVAKQLDFGLYEDGLDSDLARLLSFISQNFPAGGLANVGDGPMAPSMGLVVIVRAQRPG